MKGSYLFEDQKLPEGFAFPKKYLLMLEGVLPEIEPWWWLAPHRDSCVYWLETLREQFPQRSLIPFAKDGGSDDVACFDGADRSGNPKILRIHAFCSPGWELRGEFPDFEVWLEAALQETADFKSDAGE